MTDLTGLHSKILEIFEYIEKICIENNIPYSLDSGSVLGAIRHKGFIPWDDDLDLMFTRESYNKLLKAIKKESNAKFHLQEGRVNYPLYFSKLRLNNTTFLEKYKFKKKWKDVHQGIFVDLFAYDYASKNKIVLFFQCLFSRILVAQSLFDRGYDTAGFKKKTFMLLSMLFYPFRKKMFKLVTSVKKEDAQGFISFFACLGWPTRSMQKLDTLYNLIEVEFENKQVFVPANYEHYLTVYYGDWRTPPSKEDQKFDRHSNYFSTDEDYKTFIKSKL